MKLRREHVLPIWTKSNTDNALPRRPKDRVDMLLPMFKNPSVETADPTRVAPMTLMPLPARAKDRNERLLPN
jgi:hypothetical protein